MMGDREAPQAFRNFFYGLDIFQALGCYEV